MVTLTLTLSIILFALYYAFQGKRVVIEGKNYTLKGRLYGKIGEHKHGSAILFLSGWKPTRNSMNTSSFYAGFSARKRNNICLTVAL